MGKYSRMLSNFFKMPYELGEEERKTQIKLLIPFGLIFYFVFSYCLFGLFIGLNFIPFFVSLNIILVGVVLILCFWDKLDKKYGFRPKRSPYQCSYQFYVVLLLFSMAPAIFIFGLFLGLEMGSFWFGFGFAFAAVFPICVMFLRIKTFSDRSIPVGGGFGFMPLSYWILSVALGFFTVVRGFSGLNFYLSDGSVSLEFVAISIIIGVVVQSVVLFPDKLNKVVPFDLRTKKGFIFMIVLAFILFGLSQFLIDFIKVLIS